uniref:Transmembrane protein n=1 Tax=Cacopsylla melanoneura TaxID=428564 RepID=A0A8D9BXH2_9HEMI
MDSKMDSKVGLRGITLRPLLRTPWYTLSLLIELGVLIALLEPLIMLCPLHRTPWYSLSLLIELIALLVPLVMQVYLFLSVLLGPPSYSRLKSQLQGSLPRSFHSVREGR